MKKTNFKKPDFKKMGTTTKKFLAPYANLESPVFSKSLMGFLTKNIQTIYTIGLVLLVISFVLTFWALPCLFSFLGGLLSVFVVFVVFRLLCEQIYHNKK